MLAYITGSVNESLLLGSNTCWRKRDHQGIGNVIPFPDGRLENRTGPVQKRERLGGLLNFYHREAA